MSEVDNKQDIVEVELTEEELTTINSIRGENASLVIRMGNNKLKRLQLITQKQQLQEEEEKLEEQILALWQREQEFIDKMKEQYGEGWLYPEKGVYKYKKPIEP